MSMMDDLNRRTEQRDEEALLRTVQAFFETWAPEDRRTSAQFHHEFFQLVRRIHADSARPYQKAMESMMANSLTLSSYLPRKAE
jgi:hypothetical protein